MYCLFCVVLLLFVCKCVLYYCHRLATQLQLTNISYNIISHHITSHLITSYHIISYHIIYHIISYHITAHHIISYIIIISYHISYHIKNVAYLNLVLTTWSLFEFVEVGEIVFRLRVGFKSCVFNMQPFKSNLFLKCKIRAVRNVCFYERAGWKIWDVK
jgi:hypothetical protein